MKKGTQILEPEIACLLGTLQRPIQLKNHAKRSVHTRRNLYVDLWRLGALGGHGHLDERVVDVEGEQLKVLKKKIPLY